MTYMLATTTLEDVFRRLHCLDNYVHHVKDLFAGVNGNIEMLSSLFIVQRNVDFCGSLYFPIDNVLNLLLCFRKYTKHLEIRSC